MTKYSVDTSKAISTASLLHKISDAYDDKIRDFYYYINKLEWQGKDADAFVEMAISKQRFIEETGFNMKELAKTLEEAAIRLENTNRKVASRNGENSL